jgi:hypothetical protein
MLSYVPTPPPADADLDALVAQRDQLRGELAELRFANEQVRNDYPMTLRKQYRMRQNRKRMAEVQHQLFPLGDHIAIMTGNWMADFELGFQHENQLNHSGLRPWPGLADNPTREQFFEYFAGRAQKNVESVSETLDLGFALRQPGHYRGYKDSMENSRDQLDRYAMVLECSRAWDATHGVQRAVAASDGPAPQLSEIDSAQSGVELNEQARSLDL